MATPVDGRRRLRCGRTHSSASSPSDVGVGPRPRNSDHGHCPLFTHPGAGLAFKVGEAMAVARVVAGGAAVAVAPMVMAVGSTDIVGTAGDTYAVPVAESPDPPATFCRLESAGCVRTNMNAAMIALPPSPAENHVSSCVRIDYLQQRPKSFTSTWPLPTRRISEPNKSASSNSEFVSTSGTVHNQSDREPFKWT